MNPLDSVSAQTPAGDGAKASAPLIFGSFYLGDLEFAMALEHLQEVVEAPPKLYPMPLSPSYLLGIFNLRGSIIPVVNLKKLLQMNDAEYSCEQKIAIIDYQGANIGFAFDATGEVLRPKAEEFSEFHYKPAAESKVIKGALRLQGGQKLLQVLDPEAMVSVENIPALSQNGGLQRMRNYLTRRKVNEKKAISFTIEEARFAFEITGIHEIVQVPEIQHSLFESAHCFGMINIRAQSIPVIDLASILKLKSAENEKTIKLSEDHRIVILRLQKEAFGFLVDSVNSIDIFRPEEVLPIPLLAKERMDLFVGQISLAGGQEVMLLNHEKILSDEEILEITHGHAKLYQSDQTSLSKHSNTSLKGKEVYFVFHLGEVYAFPIKVVQEVLEYRQDFIEAPGTPELVRGLLNIRGQMYSIFDGRKIYGIHKELKASEEERKIILFNRNGNRFGLIVDSIDSIVTVFAHQHLTIPSLLQRAGNTDLHQDTKEAISISDGKETLGTSLVVLDIEAIVRRVEVALATEAASRNEKVS